MNMQKIKHEIDPEGKIFTDVKPFEAEAGMGRAYEFPFECLDRSGSGLGRIEWNIEPFYKHDRSLKRPMIIHVWVWARQTRDPRYMGKIYEIPMNTEMLSSDLTNKGDNFLDRLWCVQPYQQTNMLVLTAYPKDKHNILRVESCSSIMNRITFLPNTGALDQ